MALSGHSAGDHSYITKIGIILTRILHDNKRAASITTHFRRLLKKQGEAETREIDLNDIITETMEIVGAEALKNGVDLVVYKPNGALPVRVDFIQLQQVLINIAMNAIDAMRHCDRGERKLSVDTALNGSSVEVSVADTGTGIPPEKLNAIFDAFCSTKGHGTGLGLSIARTIVEAFDGRMWAEIAREVAHCFVLRCRYLKLRMQRAPVDVRFRPKADIAGCSAHVCFWG